MVAMVVDIDPEALVETGVWSLVAATVLRLGLSVST